MFEDFQDETEVVNINEEFIDDLIITDDKSYKGRNIFAYRFLSEDTLLNHSEMFKTIPDTNLCYATISSYYQTTAEIEMTFNLGIIPDNGNGIIPVKCV